MIEGQDHVFDVCTDECIACGASRPQIDDGYVPACEKFSGPHRIALIALNRKRLALHGRELTVGYRFSVARNLAQYEDMAQEIALLTCELAEIQTNKREITASFEFLKRANEVAEGARLKQQNPLMAVDPPVGPSLEPAKPRLTGLDGMVSQNGEYPHFVRERIESVIPEGTVLPADIRKTPEIVASNVELGLTVVTPESVARSVDAAEYLKILKKTWG